MDKISSKREKLPGYPRGLDVYEASTCPQNESSWRSAARNLGCTLELRYPYTNIYYCIPNQSKSRLVEFCYDGRSEGTYKGVCQELNDKGFLQDFNCTSFTEGCPKDKYLTETIYKYKACLLINTDKRCYLAEKDCPQFTSVETDIPTSTLKYTPDGVSTSILPKLSKESSDSPLSDFSKPAASFGKDFSNNTGLSTSLSHELYISSTTARNTDSNTVVPAAVILGVIIPLLLMFVLSAVIWRRNRRTNGKETNKEEEYLLKTEHGDKEEECIQKTEQGDFPNADFIDEGQPNMKITENIDLPMTGYKPNVSISGIKVEGKNIIIDCETSVTNDSYEITSVQWTSNGKLIDTSLAQDKYAGGTKDDPSLVIKFVDTADVADYRCIVRNEVGETESEIFKLDKVWTMPTKLQLVLCYFLLRENFQISLEKELSLPWQFLDCTIQTKEELRNVFNTFRESLNTYIVENDNSFQLNFDIIDQLLSSFMKNIKFVDIFIHNACTQNIKKYCRTPSYAAKKGEVCINLNTQQTEFFVEKLQYDILTHQTMDDFASHGLIARKLAIPVEILRGGKDNIQKYLQQLSRGKVSVYVARGMIVGCAGAGKTTLLKKLKQLPMADILNTKPTRGVDIQSDVFSVQGSSITVTSDTITTHFNINHSKVAAEQFVRKSAERKPNQHMKEHMIVDINAGIPPTSTPRKPEQHEIQSDTSKKQIKEDTKSIKTVDDLPNETADAYTTDISGGFVSSTEQHNLKPIHVLSCLSGIKKEIPKTITFFDFAGQLAYYVTHQIYLSPRAFYILVIDMTKNLEDPVEEDETFNDWTYKDVIRHWMMLIHAIHSSKIPVILVATHAEGKSTQGIKEFFLKIWKLIHEELEDSFLQSGRNFAVELRENSCIEEIKSCIVNIVQNLNHWGEEMPTSWMVFEDYMRKAKTTIKVMKMKDLWKENNKLDDNIRLEKEEDMIYMLRFFHNMGTILFFDEDALGDDIILDVPWFVDAFKHIITDPVHAAEDLQHFKGGRYTSLKNLQNSGILTASLVSAIWKLYEDSYKMYNIHMNEIMKYMERLGMLSRLTKTPEEMWYVPCMNKRSFSKDIFKKFTFSTSLCFKFRFLPSSIYYRLVATCLNHLNFKIPKWPKPEYFYKNAVLLHKKQFDYKYYVLIGSDEIHSIIEVQILSEEGYSFDRQHVATVKDEITEQLNRLAQTFCTNLGNFTVGYRCRSSVFHDEPGAHFIPESDFEGKTILCSECNLKRIDVESVLSQWNQKSSEKEGTFINTDEDQSSWSNVVLSKRLFVRGASQCSHITCFSSDSAWVSDEEGVMRLVDSRKGVIKTISVQGYSDGAHGVGSHTVSPDGDLVFIDNDQTHVYKVENDELILVLRTVEFQMMCIFSSSHNGDLLIGGVDRYKNGVVIRYDAARKTRLQKIQTDKTRALYKRPSYITENKNGDIIVSEYVTGVLVVVDKSGGHRFTYSGQSPGSRIGPGGVCTDSSGHILFCEILSNSVHILNSEGKFISHFKIMDGDIQSPVCIGLDNMRCLWIADWDRNSICIYR